MSWLCGAIFLSDFIPDWFFSYHRHHRIFLFIVVLIYLLHVDEWDYSFRSLILPEVLYEWLYYCYISLFYSRPLSAWLSGVVFSKDLFQHNDAISTTLFFCLSLIIYLEWMWILVGITDYIRRTFLSYYIIATHQYLLRDPYSIDLLASHSLAILF